VLLVQALAAQNVSIELEDGVFRLKGWDAKDAPAAGWPAVLAVRVGTPDAAAMPGTYAVEGGELSFRPVAPLSPGSTYDATANLPRGVWVNRIFKLPGGLRPSARVEHIYPSVDVLPANVRKLYIQFSAPMNRSEARTQLRLLDSSGRAIGLAQPEQALWDVDGKRLTVLLDPETPLAEGKSYRLLVDKAWHDARGATLIESFEKSFTTVPPVNALPSIENWQLRLPRAGTSSPLVVRFPAPMDSWLLEKTIRIAGTDGVVVIADYEREWRFVPSQPWKAGTYELVGDSRLEDICGNHLEPTTAATPDSKAPPGRAGAESAKRSFTIR
jgi:hypothetical protein